MHFTKMQGAGNDFIIINNMEEKLPLSEIPGLAARLCRRRISAGADGLILVTEAGAGGNFGMRFYNSDGSPGEMCGNGARCLSRFGFERGLSGERVKIETDAGFVLGRRITEELYRVRLNDPGRLRLYCKVQAKGQEYNCTYMELGNPGIPHAVVPLPGFGSMDKNELRELGREIRRSDEFPKGANVSFVEITGPDRVKALTYERGVEDFTLSCGTGCGSIAAALTLRGLVSGKNVRISMPGGELSVSLSCEGGCVTDIFLTGPALFVYEAELRDV
ncbi:MAG: diaminopimelate epimerase [Candidatus Limivicinus sp.]|jgi:diaminopimelate epimerase